MSSKPIPCGRSRFVFIICCDSWWLEVNQYVALPDIIDCYPINVQWLLTVMEAKVHQIISSSFFTVHTFKLGQVNSFLIVLRYNYWKRKILTTRFHSRNNLVFIYTGFVKVVWPQFSKLSISYILWYIICRSRSCQ